MAQQPGARERSVPMGKSSLDEYVITFGKYKGKRLADISLKALDSYLGWLEREATGTHALLLTDYLKTYLKHYERELEQELES